MPTNNFRTPDGDLENQTYITESWLIDQWIGDELWTWGYNSYGYLGTNGINGRSTPVTTFAGGNNWKQVSCGNRHSAAIKTDGSLWVWGRNDSGQLGINNITTRSTPVTTFAGGFNWKQVSCGESHTTAIKTDGTLWVWGSNSYGQLGDNTSTTNSRSTPVTTFAGGNNWKQVSASPQLSHTAAVKIDGSLWTWGYNGYGGLGDNSITNRSTPVTTFAGGNDWKQVSCGSIFTAAIKTNGTLWLWGRGNDGQLGINDINNKLTPVTTFTGGNDWKQVSAGSDAVTTAIKTNGSLWTWGINDNLLLGTGNSTTRSTPVTTFAGGNNWKQVSRASAIKTDGSLWVWGNGGINLGTNNTTNAFTPITTLAGGYNWKQIDRGGNHIIAITSGPDY